MKVLAIASAATFALAGQSSAWVHSDVTLENVPVMAVKVEDSATGGCWTNMGEAKTYAEDKLKILGFAITENYVESNAFLEIEVFAFRGNDGVCLGVITAALIALAETLSLEETQTVIRATIGEARTIFRRSENANLLVLEVIEDQMSEIEEKLGEE